MHFFEKWKESKGNKRLPAKSDSLPVMKFGRYLRKKSFNARSII
jgi:hypothetical protein